MAEEIEIPIKASEVRRQLGLGHSFFAAVKRRMGLRSRRRVMLTDVRQWLHDHPDFSERDVYPLSGSACGGDKCLVRQKSEPSVQNVFVKEEIEIPIKADDIRIQLGLGHSYFAGVKRMMGFSGRRRLLKSAVVAWLHANPEFRERDVYHGSGCDCATCVTRRRLGDQRGRKGKSIQVRK